MSLNFTTYIITLEKRNDRIISMKNFYQNYLNEINFFYGVTADEIKKHKKQITTKFCNSFCTSAMIGCASSHILLWNEISKRKDGYYLILEDDTFIDLKYLNNLFSDIKAVFDKSDNLFLQLVGEGFILQKTEKINKLIFENYSYHFFLGAYIIKPDTAKKLFNYFSNEKINYHIDLSLNNACKKENIKILLLKNRSIGEQKGLTDSNMVNLSLRENKCFNTNNFPRLYYVLNLPICSVFNIIISFMVIFLILCVYYNFITKNIFGFCIIGFLIMEILKTDL